VEAMFIELRAPFGLRRRRVGAGMRVAFCGRYRARETHWSAGYADHDNGLGEQLRSALRDETVVAVSLDSAVRVSR
jgi:ferric-dicitrate binding protein FerR (iron transport regulator)